MRLGEQHVGYCTNVHPGEGLDEIERMLVTHVAAVKRRVAPNSTFGLGLRLGHAAAATLAGDAGRLGRFADLCAREDFEVFTVNGFPYGDFAARSVKAAVYEPSWLEPERLTYTLQLARALAAMPGPRERTISTVAGAFRGPTGAPAPPEVVRGLAARLGEAARALAEIEVETGVHVRLCLEPEPWTTLETTADAVQLFTDHLLPQGEAAREHLGLCYDCCHQAVHFEDPVESLAALAAAGIVVGKVQVSSALHLAKPGDFHHLLRFDEPRYLHQVVGRQTDGGLLRALDLAQLRAPPREWLEAEAWRCHFHVPLWWDGDGVLGTTRRDWESAVRAARRPGLHLEVETYTWDVIPAADRAHLEGGDLHACMAAEFAALRRVLEA